MLRIARLVLGTFAVAGVTAVPSVSTAASSAPTGDPVTIYMVTDGDASTGSENIPAKSGLEAGVAALNARGGLLGHPVEVKFCENPFNIDQAVQCVTDALNDPTAIAFVGNSTNSGEQIDPMILEAGLPIIAGLPLTPAQETSPNEFPLHLGAEMFPAAGRLAADNGAERILVGSILTEGTSGMEDLIGRLLEDTPASVEGTVSLPLGKPDLSAEATRADTDGDAIVMVVDAATLGRFAAAVGQQGGDVQMVTGALTAGKIAMNAGGDTLNGIQVVRSYQPLEADVPGNEMFLDDMTSIGAEDWAVDEAAVNTWLGVQVLEQAATAADSVEPGALMEALDSMSDVDTFGLTQPIDFTSAPSYFDGSITRVFNPWVLYATVEDGTYVPATGEWVNVLEGH